MQNWLDPFRQDRAVLEWCRDNGVAYTSYSTLGGQWTHQRAPGGGGQRSNPVFTSRVLRRIADRHTELAQEAVTKATWGTAYGIPDF